MILIVRTYLCLDTLSTITESITPVSSKETPLLVTEFTLIDPSTQGQSPLGFRFRDVHPCMIYETHIGPPTCPILSFTVVSQLLQPLPVYLSSTQYILERPVLFTTLKIRYLYYLNIDIFL